MKNIYWCYDKNIYYGAYIVAESRNKARMYAAEYFDIDYININAKCHQKNVDEKEGKMFECTDAVNIKKYNLNYRCDECGFTADCPYAFFYEDADA